MQIQFYSSPATNRNRAKMLGRARFSARKISGVLGTKYSVSKKGCGLIPVSHFGSDPWDAGSDTRVGYRRRLMLFCWSDKGKGEHRNAVLHLKRRNVESRRNSRAVARFRKEKIRHFGSQMFRPPSRRRALTHVFQLGGDSWRAEKYLIISFQNRQTPSLRPAKLREFTKSHRVAYWSVAQWSLFVRVNPSYLWTFSENKKKGQKTRIRPITPSCCNNRAIFCLATFCFYFAKNGPGGRLFFVWR